MKHTNKLHLIILLSLSFSLNLFAGKRERINFDENWKFHAGHATDYKKDFNYGLSRLFGKTAENYGTCIHPGFDDSTWRTVDLPHDWAVELPFEYSPNGDIMTHGYKPIGGLYPQNSIGWYRKTFRLDAQSDTTRQVSITFDGVFRDSEVWINGFYLGKHMSGYTGFTYNITDFVRYDRDNVLVVRADASKIEGWFYEGAGIYRHVWLNFFDDLHIGQNGVYIQSQLTDNYNNATVSVETHIENLGSHASGNLYTVIQDREGKEVARTEPIRFSINDADGTTIVQKITITNPRLWDLDDPYQYSAVSYVTSGNDVRDKVRTRFGIREIRITADKGLFLNNKPIKIKGVCCHQDHAGVGSALPDFLQYYRIGLLKEMGANAYRSTHNPPTPELLEACDSLGMLVLNETRLMNSGPEYMRQLEELVLRDRNHPSVFMWCIGNEEEVFQSTVEGKRIALSMMRKINQLDPSRTVTYGANLGNVVTGVNEVIPVRGFNYNIYGVDDYRKSCPDQPVFGSEVGSTVTTRGVYRQDTVRNYLTDYDENYPPWASTAEQWWTFAAKREWFMGGFVWTGFDYRGEPTPYKWPNINSHFGIMDVCGFPKNIYYYYQSWWTDKDILHITPHWNHKPGELIKVWVNSNADSVELFLNNKSLGIKQMPRNGHLVWEVKYKPGRLKAVAHKGNKTFEKTIETTKDPIEIVLTPVKTHLEGNGRDATVVNVTVCDSRGNEVPTADNMIQFTLSGDAKIIGMGNGDPSCHEPDKGENGIYQRSLFHGKCQVIIRSGKSAGEVVFNASSDNLKSSSITLIQRK